MADITDNGGENADGSVHLVPLDQAPGLVLQMVARLEMGQCEPMIIGVSGRPVAALISMEDLRRLREYDQQVLDAEDSFYFELDQRLHLADTEQTSTDLDAFARSFGPRGERKCP